MISFGSIKEDVYGKTKIGNALQTPSLNPKTTVQFIGEIASTQVDSIDSNWVITIPLFGGQPPNYV